MEATQQLSEYGKFIQEVIGYRFFKPNGQPLYKYVLFEKGYRTLEQIKKKRFDIVVKERKK